MTQKQFIERRSLILPRLNNAIKVKCYRTARARLKELTFLECEYKGTEYTETYRKLQHVYNLTDKIVI